MAKTIVYKFGGASIKDADSVKNLAEILRNRLRKNMLIVVSAMGKTTNALEEILSLRMSESDYSQKSANLKSFHLGICQELFPEGHRIFPKLENLFIQLQNLLYLEVNEENYDECYDGIIAFGELISSRIVMEYLCEQGMVALWQDARELILTSSDFRFAKVDWAQTKKRCNSILQPNLDQYPVITQGFIGADSKGRTTTLGREGSDFSAAIFASSLGASSVTIWKDVPGVLNCDPKIFKDSELFSELDYLQAAQMTYYGASVIHPKTIKPLANLGIPLFVKSFLKPDEAGTKIYSTGKLNPIPSIILKRNQIMVSLRVTDFAFIEESHIHEIYTQLDHLKLKVNMLQTSAIGVTIIIDDELFKLNKLVSSLEKTFSIRYNEGLELLTILNPHKGSFENLSWMEILLEQRTRNTIQIVTRGLHTRDQN
ncbi:aspartate kinase [Algoriphagus zhangzhouensis]|uniref:Aspartokinase n=1 Tax=Algoriphagus zhangzhouensis TaxID=1073327 RepID=A0A1M7Z903_9BACT|nr:aspartate kinase [Algoriphagus zhangzhouensis]TDY47528.1 aspartate kinase [Algoriphagus zhangzhouensis]SHO61344.1 aspartate kinase [Algoriphagus zhangzhouensis]